jgi:hypothetical protein
LPGAWFYPSGRVVTLEPGKIGGKWFWPNGQLIAYNMGSPETMWFRPSGDFFMFGPKFDPEFLKDVPSVLIHIEEWLSRSDEPTPMMDYFYPLPKKP